MPGAVDSPNNAARIVAACDDLCAGRVPDEADLELVVRAARAFVEKPSRARKSFMHQEPDAERNRWIRKLAAKYCGSVQNSAKTIEQWISAYRTDGWLRDRHAVACPEHLAGTRESYIWQSLKAGAKVLKERQLRTILAGDPRQ